ncbi:MAG: hypothetical protein IPL27_26395 [Lewinellaceae bacterium]|nr:hypothetical protein [Lewinellaceae bacterium]
MGGVGLDNIRQRLELNYPGRYRLEIRQEEGRFVSVLEIGGGGGGGTPPLSNYSI